MFPQLTFEWNNLIAAINDSEFGAKFKDNKSGIRVNDYNRIFNPVIDEVESCFTYTTWGEVIPKKSISEGDYQKARRTIEIFNLNHNSLRNRRKSLVKIVNCYCEMSKEDILDALKDSGFFSLLNQILI